MAAPPAVSLGKWMGLGGGSPSTESLKCTWGIGAGKPFGEMFPGGGASQNICEDEVHKGSPPSKHITKKGVMIKERKGIIRVNKVKGESKQD